MDFDGTKRKQTIYVGGLHEDSEENELMDIFSAFGVSFDCACSGLFSNTCFQLPGDIMDVQIPPAPQIHRDQPRESALQETLLTTKP